MSMHQIRNERGKKGRRNRNQPRRALQAPPAGTDGLGLRAALKKKKKKRSRPFRLGVPFFRTVSLGSFGVCKVDSPGKYLFPLFGSDRSPSFSDPSNMQIDASDIPLMISPAWPVAVR